MAMDLFDLALEEDVTVQEATATPALSQGVAPSQGVAATRDGCKEISATHCPRAKRALPAVAMSEQPRGSKNPRRHQNPKNSLQLECIEFKDGDHVPCVFVKTGQRQIPVPLWRQYRASWRDIDFGTATWVLVSNYESWVMDLVDAITNKSVRDVAKTFADLFRKQFHAAMAAARMTQNLLENPLDSDDDSPGNTAPRQGRDCADVRSVVVEITLGDYTVTVLNSRRKMTLKIDETAVKFVTGFVLPLIRMCATRKAPSQGISAPSAASSQDDLGLFRLPEDPTPNVRDKVVWSPMSHKWNVLLRKPTDKLAEHFSADSTQDAQTYEMQKVEAYWRAVEAWNRLDSSSRLRIPMTRIAAT